MEKVDGRVCLDTDACISILNNEERAKRLIDAIEFDNTYTSVVTLFELLMRETNLGAIETLRSKVTVLEFNENASRKASYIYKDLKKKGKLIEIKDLFIAAICIINNCKLATFNKKHFENIKELKLIKI